MKKINILIRRAKKALESAGVLLDKGDYEGSVSRSYYAMFYATEALLLTKGLKFSSHKSVISLFGEHFIKTGVFKTDMGKKLKKAFEERLDADYGYAFNLNTKDANEILESAEEFVKEIEKYLIDAGYLK